VTKIIKLEDLAGVGGVLAHGVFDFLHVGHVRYFQRAAAQGPLTITVTCDEFVNKGQRRPYFNHHLRCEMIAAIECVKHVAISFGPHGTLPISVIKPKFYCKGTEYLSKQNPALMKEISEVRRWGGDILFIDDDGKEFSSTAILKAWDGR
jgi:cytidyltransferase-like protein